MFVGESGVMRIVQRTCEKMREHDTDDVGPFGAIPLALLQKWVNFHYSICLDLFGSEDSTNAANYYAMGLKGRYQESKIDDDHVLADRMATVPALEDGKLVSREVTALKAMNETLRDAFVADSQRGINRFNKVIDHFGIDAALCLPHRAFHRNIGAFAGIHAAPDGTLVDEATWAARHDEWLPSAADRAFVQTLMHPVTEPGAMAGWIAQPRRGIHGQPLDYRYVEFH